MGTNSKPSISSLALLECHRCIIDAEGNEETFVDSYISYRCAGDRRQQPHTDPNDPMDIGSIIPFRSSP
jgi:hypothetical protein